MSGPSGDNGSFEKRLARARKRAGIGQEAGPQRGRVDALEGSAWRIGLRVGVELVSGLAVAVGSGWLLARWLHTGPWLVALFVPLGGAAGVLNVWRIVAPRNGKPG